MQAARDLVGSFYRGQLQVYALATAKLAAGGLAEPTQEIVDEAVNALQADFRKTADVTVNPVYGADDSGVAGTTDPSLSKAVSDYAKDAVSDTPSGPFVDALPAGARCG